MEQLVTEGRCLAGDGAYILCSNTEYEHVIQSWDKKNHTIDIDIEKAVAFQPYFEYTRKIKSLNEVPVMIASPSSVNFDI